MRLLLMSLEVGSFAGCSAWLGRGKMTYPGGRVCLRDWEKRRKLAALVNRNPEITIVQFLTTWIK